MFNSRQSRQNLPPNFKQTAEPQVGDLLVDPLAGCGTIGEMATEKNVFVISGDSVRRPLIQDPSDYRIYPFGCKYKHRQDTGKTKQVPAFQFIAFPKCPINPHSIGTRCCRMRGLEWPPQQPNRRCSVGCDAAALETRLRRPTLHRSTLRQKMQIR